MSKSRYRFRKVSALISLILGGLIDYAKIYSKPFGFFLICGMGPLIYLTYYELFRGFIGLGSEDFHTPLIERERDRKFFGKVIPNLELLTTLTIYLRFQCISFLFDRDYFTNSGFEK